MDEPTVDEWLDRHHVDVIRTHATTLDGVAIGKYLHRSKFIKTLPGGHNIADMALGMDLAGVPHLTFWHAFRNAHLGDIKLKPDLDTIIWDGNDPDLGHVICDFVDTDEKPIALCPRSLLKRLVTQVSDLGYQIKAAFELEFFLFNNTYEELRQSNYSHFSPVTASTSQFLYSARNAYHALPFMNEVTRRLNTRKIPWESWNDEGGAGQLELNFPAGEPLAAADSLVRVKQIIYETAVDLGMTASFMPHIRRGSSSGLHIHHSLLDTDGRPVFANENGRTPLLQHWIAGIVNTVPAATSILCPTINAYRRFSDFSGPPMTPSWGEENKTSALRLISNPADAARIEHRLPSSDANPYLALATILAGGITGLLGKLSPPPENEQLGWGLPASDQRLPQTISSASDLLENCDSLKDVLGEDVIDYWVNSRRWEWLAFHSETDNPADHSTTGWEFQRYFELI